MEQSFNAMIPYAQALGLIHACGENLRAVSETVLLEQSVGRILAADIIAPMANQPFDNSAMDGFALRAEDLSRASNDNPAALEMIEHVAAGGALASRSLSTGQCYEIMTGAPLPPGCDAVVPVEKIKKTGNGKILFDAPTVVGDNIRRKGADIQAGETLLSRGVRVTPEHILALSTIGVGKISVSKCPRVALLSTGPEVVDDLSSPLQQGQIYNATGPYLRAMLAQMGADVLPLGTVGDDPSLFKKKILDVLSEKPDIILSTGAVSAGVHDFVPSVLRDLGAEIFFHKVAIRPGKPVFFARLPKKGPVFFGLPGNPVSTAVGLRFFVHPLYLSLQGLPPEQPRTARLAKDYTKKKADLRFFLRAFLRETENGVQEITILEDQQSFMVSPFVKSNVWVSIAEDCPSLEAGDAIEFFP